MDDQGWMKSAIALGAEARGTTAPNPNVGCVIVKDGRAIGHGRTQPGGRPHAEAVALEQAGSEAEGATFYVSLEPCAHQSARGPACTDLIVAARPARIVIAATDPDPRTNGKGIARLREAGIRVEADLLADEASAVMEGFFSRIQHRRPFVTLKLAMSLDGKIALPSGESKWITGEDARHHVHEVRAQSDMILVGRGTLLADDPQLNVRLPGLEDRSPRKALLTRGEAPEGWTGLAGPQAIFDLGDVNDLLVEGGSGAASAFLSADLVDRLLLYRAPILIGEGKSALGYIGLTSLADAHQRWRFTHAQTLGIDRLEVYERDRS